MRKVRRQIEQNIFYCLTGSDMSLCGF